MQSRDVFFISPLEIFLLLFLIIAIISHKYSVQVGQNISRYCFFINQLFSWVKLQFIRVCF